ncbi:MAG: class I SAM-dependent methyltransferase [Planctomycetota bacterium]|nr:MAG: class I SAM-dependent methyltransferase [Planctomycetota bacterium]
MLERLDPAVSSPTALREYYDARHAPRMVRESDRFYRWVLDEAGLAEGSNRTLLDIGCGGGYLLREAYGRGFGVTGCDISIVAVKTARSIAGPVVVGADAERLPFPDSAFDVVANIGNLEHFLNMPAGAREMARVAKPDGTVLVLVPNSMYSGDIWRFITRGELPTHNQAVERFASEKEWRRLLEGEGLSIGKVTRYDKFKAWKKIFPRRYAYCFLFICSRPNDGRK